MNVCVVLPGVHQHCGGVGQRHEPFADQELCVIAVELQQDVAMRMGVAHKSAIHVEQRDPAEKTMHDP